MSMFHHVPNVLLSKTDDEQLLLTSQLDIIVLVRASGPDRLTVHIIHFLLQATSLLSLLGTSDTEKKLCAVEMLSTLK